MSSTLPTITRHTSGEHPTDRDDGRRGLAVLVIHLQGIPSKEHQTKEHGDRFKQAVDQREPNGLPSIPCGMIEWDGDLMMCGKVGMFQWT